MAQEVSVDDNGEVTWQGLLCSLEVVPAESELWTTVEGVPRRCAARSLKPSELTGQARADVKAALEAIQSQRDDLAYFGLGLRSMGSGVCSGIGSPRRQG